MLKTRFCPDSVPFWYASNSIVFGCGRSCVSLSTVIEAPGMASRIALPVPCPSPVYASEPYSVTRNASASGKRAANARAARKGPTVWELEGPLPVLYTLAMLLAEHIPLSQVEILATDIDEEILAKAQEGRYIEKSVAGLPKKYRDKYIIPDEKGYVRVSDEIKKRITFKKHNLLKDPYPTGMHLIVCRNVMIYFTEEAKDQIYQKFSNSLVDNGLFFVGSTEQIIGAAKYGFQSKQSFFYEKSVK